MSVLKQRNHRFLSNLQKALLDANQSNVKYLSVGGTDENGYGTVELTNDSTDATV